MVKLAIALIMFVSGMAPAVSCELSSDTSVQIVDFDSLNQLDISNQQSSSEKETSQSLPCAFCSPICHHAVTLSPSAEILPILNDVFFFDLPVDAYSSVDLYLPKEPPRFS